MGINNNRKNNLSVFHEAMIKRHNKSHFNLFCSSLENIHIFAQMSLTVTLYLLIKQIMHNIFK